MLINSVYWVCFHCRGGGAKKETNSTRRPIPQDGRLTGVLFWFFSRSLLSMLQEHGLKWAAHPLLTFWQLSPSSWNGKNTRALGLNWPRGRKHGMVVNGKYSCPKQVCRGNYTGICVRSPRNVYIKNNKSGAKRSQNVQAHEYPQIWRGISAIKCLTSVWEPEVGSSVVPIRR